MIRRLLARGRDDSGAVMIEFAIVLPVVLALIFGSFEVSQLVRAQMKVSNAADVYAELIATQGSVNAATLANYCTGAQLVIAPFSTATFSASVSSVSYNANTGAAAVDWQNTACGGGTAISSPTGLTSTLVTSPGDTVIIVQATYKYTSVLSYVLPANFTLSQTVFARPREGLPITSN